MRIRRLREAVEQHKSLHVRDAAELLDVSEMTIRRDIRDNPNMFAFLGGHIVDTGAGESRSPYDLSHAAEEHEAEKRAACAHALAHVAAKETIFVDCGTTLVHLVRLLPTELELTLVCYALNTADVAVRKPNLRLILLGGSYDPGTTSFAPLDEDGGLNGIAINTAFLSAAGLDRSLGATCATFPEAVVKRAAMARAQKRILVTDTSKIGRVRQACFATVDEFDLILTETGPLDLTE